MFDEHEARRLLGRAADTIEVSSALSAPPPPRRRTALIAAAAVAALAVGGGIVASQLDIGDDNQDPTAPHADGTVPSVFSHSEGSARALLSAAGYDVKIEERHACTEAGRAEQTRPVAGSPLPARSAVTLVVSLGPAPGWLCESISNKSDWEFLDFANGRGPAPRFAKTVTVVLDGGKPYTLTSDEASDPDAWGDPLPLKVLADATHEVQQINGTWVTPVLAVTNGIPKLDRCGVTRPAFVGFREARTLDIEFLVDGVFGCPPSVDVYRTDGLIDSVVIHNKKGFGAGGPEHVGVPILVGHTYAEAEDRLRSLDLVAEARQVATCTDRPGRVIAQRPRQTSRAVRGSAVMLDVAKAPASGCDYGAAPDMEDVAELFVKFARGEISSPPVDTPVDLYLGHTLQKTIGAVDANDPATYDLCTAYAGVSCPMSAVRLISEHAGGLQYDAAIPNLSCLETLGELPPGLDDPRRTVAISPREAGGCGEQWVVLLSVNDVGQVGAVDVVLGAP
ncbi:PASTA domain-containing protein [Nocardioides jensenii]|uniref:PASTA domain-containing protein n=1 Tax=Nocardioides jensenii TaxID=1843 RepID=UPI00082EC506|nr:PASTA domain-containing protein [Nocardioides jensenii]